VRGFSISGRVFRIVLGTTMLAIVVTRFGITVASRGLLTGLDLAVAAISLLFAAGVFLQGSGRTIRERLRDEKWLSAFTALFVILLAALLSGLGGREPGSTLRDIVRLCHLYSFLCSLRVLLGAFGTWVLDNLSPVAILPMTFVLLILAGTVLLMLPASTRDGFVIDPLDALFTSASATCVTGLTVLDTGTDFTMMGQIVILTLIQVGGLGLMTFVAVFALFLGQSAGLKEATSLSRVMNADFVSNLKRLLASMIGWTLAIEAAGAFILYLILNAQDTGWTTGTTIWQSVFHSISAFCNAGFSLDPSTPGTHAAASNLEGFARVPGVPLTIGVLIMLGGMGFLVLTSVVAAILHRLRTGSKKRLPVQERLVLMVTGVLVILGFALFLVLEWDNTLRGMNLPQKLSNAFLGSVTPRTAGFNTVPTAGLLPAVKWILVAMMFVGASPGGTGGGVKTTTVGLIAVGFVSMLRRRRSAELWNRRIPSQDLKRASAVLLFGLLVFFVSAMALLITESSGLPAGGDPFSLVFESMSAFGTVGLSLGVTGGLTPAGKVVIICTMFLGRIGPATLVAASGRALVSGYRYPEAKLMIG